MSMIYNLHSNSQSLWNQYETNASSKSNKGFGWKQQWIIRCVNVNVRSINEILSWEFGKIHEEKKLQRKLQKVENLPLSIYQYLFGKFWMLDNKSTILLIDFYIGIKSLECL